MVLKFVCLALVAVAAALTHDQQPLTDLSKGSSDLIRELKKAEVIPTVIDSFKPKLTLSIFWENATAEVGNAIDPSRLQKQPDVQFIHHAPDLDIAIAKKMSKMQLTLAMTDPDAPSRSNPKWSEICHWIATDIQLTDPSSSTLDGPAFSDAVTEIMPYKPPGPPPKTGKHRYIFVALAPKNGTTEKLHLRKPGGRKHWGHDGEEVGMRKWAGEMGLEVVGANFIYAEDEVQ